MLLKKAPTLAGAFNRPNHLFLSQLLGLPVLDLMLIGQGQLESLPIMTADPAFALYDVKLLW